MLVEMYRNMRANLAEDGVVAIWSEELNPFSSVSQIIYRTLKEVFPHVMVDVSSGLVLFYASPTRSDLPNYLSPESQRLSSWLAEASAWAPVNRLDNLVMNRHKFTVWGDSTWERIQAKY